MFFQHNYLVMLLDPNKFKAQTTPVDISDALKVLLNHPIISDAYPGCTLIFNHLYTNPSVSVPNDIYAEMSELDFEQERTLMQEVRLISTIKDSAGIILGESECRCILFAQEGSQGSHSDINLILDCPNGLIGEYNLSVLSPKKLHELIFKQQACGFLHIKAQEKYPVMGELKEHIYNLGLCADLVKNLCIEGPQQPTSPAVRDAFEKPLQEIQRCIIELRKEMPAQHADSLKPLEDFAKRLTQFLGARPLGMFLKFTFGMHRALSKLFQYAETSESLMEIPDASMELRATADALCEYYRSDFLLNQFGSICHALGEESKNPVLNYKKISKLLQSPQFKDYPLSEFSLCGESLLKEIIAFIRVANFIDLKLKKASETENPLVLEEARKLFKEFIDLAFELNHWWKLHSLFDVVNETNKKSEENNQDNKYSELFAESPLFSLDLSKLNENATEKIINSTVDWMRKRNSYFGSVPTYSVTRFSTQDDAILNDGILDSQEFPLSTVAVPESVFDAIAPIEMRNLYSEQNKKGLSHPTGKENLRFLITECNASIYGAFNRERKLGGFFIILPFEEHLPATYKDKLTKAIEIGLIPFDARSVWGEVIVIDESIRDDFRDAKRLGSEELFDAVWRHEAGKASWEERGNEIPRLNHRPIYLAGMVGVDNQAAIDRYLSEGWIIPMTPESIIEENGSKYYLMAKPFASRAFRYELK